MVMALEGNFDLLLCLAQVGTSIDSIESKTHPKGFPKEFKCQDGHWRVEGFRGVSTQ